MSRMWIFITLAILAVSSSSYAAISTRVEAQKNCGRVEKLKVYSEKAIRRAQVSLPTLAYYKAHPDELAVAKKTLAVEQRDFTPSSCARAWFLP